MVSVLLVIHPVPRARWEKQVVPQLVSCWREKKRLLFRSRSQPEQPLLLLLAQVNGKRRVSTQCLPQLLLLLESSLWIFFFFCGKIKQKCFNKTGMVFFRDLEYGVC